MKRIGIFLSSKEGLPHSYRAAAEEVGRWIGRTGRTLVYGGSRRGLMEVLAHSVRQNGGRVIGVVPQVLMERNLVSDECNITFNTADLNDRKATMVRESEVLIALPGGIGTLDELFTILAANSIGTESRKVVLYNTDGCWDALIALIDGLHGKGLAGKPARSLLSVVTTVEELEQICS